MSDQYKTVMEKAMSCIHLARAINDQYPDPARMPAEKVEERKRLVAEGHRLKGIAEVQRQQDELDGWAAAPADDHPALKAMAEAQHTKADVDDAVSAAAAQRQTKAFFDWMRGKQLSAEQKASLVEDSTGQVIVPHDITGPIFKELPHRGIFRSSGPLVRRTTSNLVDVRSLTNATAGWQKLETGGTPATDANVVPNTPVQTIEVHDLLALSKVGVDELADTDANLTALIQQIVSLQFAQMEDDAFADGSGTSRPWGLANRATAGGPVITQGVTAGTADVVHGDELKKLQYAVPTVFRGGGVYYSSDTAAQAIALLKDGNSNYIWQPSVRAGEPDTLFGKRFYTLEGLPALTATSAPSVMFGDPSLGYMVADRQQIAVQRLNERYADEGLVGFLFKLRVGGDVIRPKAFAKYIV